MKHENISECLVVSEWAKYKYPKSNIIVAWANSSEDMCKEFSKKVFGKDEMIVSEYIIIEGEIQELRDILKANKKECPDNIPYMILYVNGEPEDENT